jgi:hypothetical protein
VDRVDVVDRVDLVDGLDAENRGMPCSSRQQTPTRPASARLARPVGLRKNVYSVHSVYLSARISLKDSNLSSVSLENRYIHARTSIFSKNPENP